MDSYDKLLERTSSVDFAAKFSSEIPPPIKCGGFIGKFRTETLAFDGKVF